MKIQKIALLGSALAIGLSTTLSAAPRGKHPVDPPIHKHGSQVSAAPGNTIYPTSGIAHLGPPGKGIAR